jgi:uncharacterized DUF497 family protein
MKFIWDENKNKSNIRKHDIDFKDATEIFNYQMLCFLDTRKNYGEERWIGIGVLKGSKAVIIYTEDELLEEIRIISVRKATINESEKFKKKFGN